MKTVSEHFAAMFLEVKKVRETLAMYCLAPDKVPVSLDDINEAIFQLYEVKIKTSLVPIKSELIRGMVEIYHRNATIYIDSALNKAWTRYVSVKETCQIMIVNAENVTEDPGDIIEYFVHRMTLPAAVEKSAAIISEEVAMIGAIELLFPFELRQAAKDRIINGTDTIFTTAEWLEIPEFLVEFALSDEYFALSNGMWNPK
jgi:hypothetical protein